MESASTLEKASEPPSHRWANLIGTLIALLTLTIPVLAIGYYSSHNPSVTDQSYSVTPSEH